MLHRVHEEFHSEQQHAEGAAGCSKIKPGDDVEPGRGVVQKAPRDRQDEADVVAEHGDAQPLPANRGCGDEGGVGHALEAHLAGARVEAV